MSNNIGSFPNFSALGSGLPVLRDTPHPNFEVPSVQERVELIAQPAINPLMGSTVNHPGEMTSQPNPFVNRPKGYRFTLEEDIEIFYAKVSKRSFGVVAKKLEGKTEAQIINRWDYLSKLDPDLKNKVLSARASQIKSSPFDQMHDYEKGAKDVLAEPIQPPSRYKEFKKMFGEFRLVFSIPNSLGDVFIKKDQANQFTDDDDQVLIRGKVNGQTVNQIADRLPGKTLNQINHRWRQLRGPNPHLENIVERTRLEQVHLLYLEPVKPSFEFDPLPSLLHESKIFPLVKEHDSEKGEPGAQAEPIQPPNRYMKYKKPFLDFRLVFSTANSIEEVIIKKHQAKVFSEAEDEVVIGGKVNGETSREIANRLPGKKVRQIQHRWRQLKTPNPDLVKTVNRPLSDQVNFLFLEQVKPAVEFDPLSFLLPDPQALDMESANKN